MPASRRPRPSPPAARTAREERTPSWVRQLRSIPGSPTERSACASPSTRAPRPTGGATRDFVQTAEDLGFDAFTMPDHPAVLPGGT